MSANTLEKPEQVTSEILRYATDLPGQALCYRWGCLKFRELRAKAEARSAPNSTSPISTKPFSIRAACRSRCSNAASINGRVSAPLPTTERQSDLR
jgi:hypothetical protein